MTKVVEWQRIKVQEIILDQNDVECGHIPTVECELTEDLTGNVSLGEMITVNGILKALPKDQCSYVMYIRSSLWDRRMTRQRSAGTADDLEAFKLINTHSNPFK